MGQRSRKRGQRSRPPDASAPATTPPRPPARAPRPSAEERNAAVREALHPLAPGERPLAVTIGALIAALVGAGNLIAWLAGAKVAGKHPAAGGIILFSLIMLVCAGGMWRLRYWAVLGFEALLAIIVLLFTLLLTRASNLLGFLIPIVVISGGGLLFYKLIRTLSRIQMPRYTGR
ncbi:MAG: hypothetical protein ACXVQR_05400 [Solirubrobacteraceae bacterium]